MVDYPELVRRVNAYASYLRYKMFFALKKRDSCEPNTLSHLRWATKHEAYRTALNQFNMHVNQGKKFHPKDNLDA